MLQVHAWMNTFVILILVSLHLKAMRTNTDILLQILIVLTVIYLHWSLVSLRLNSRTPNDGVGHSSYQQRWKISVLWLLWVTKATVRNMSEVLDLTTEGRAKDAPRGKKKKERSSPYATVPLPPCKVCGGTATGYHFGVITCEACKVGFDMLCIDWAGEGIEGLWPTG